MRLFTRSVATATVLITACSFMFTACNKVKNTDGEDSGYGTDHALLEKTFSDVQSIADEAGNSGGLSNYRIVGGSTVLSGCVTVTNDTGSVPHILTVDFGSSNCLCNDGIYRRGRIILSYTGRYKETGHMHSISFDNYYVNDNGVSGSKTVTNTGTNALGNPVYDISVVGAISLANGAGTISWNSTRTRTWIGGATTTSWKDDVYEISGSGTVTRANGKTFDMTITTPLHIALDCRWIESGVVEIRPAGGAVRSLDYGNGACDAQANYTVNGKTYSITLK